MDETDLQELRNLVEFLKENGIAQFEMERPDLKVKLKFAGASGESGTAGGVDLAHLAQVLGAGAAAGAHTPVLSAPVPMTAEAAAEVSAALTAPAEVGSHTVKSPLVGTFYPAPSPGATPFVAVGDRVREGQVLCIVEAMKLMNEVESDVAGEVVAVLVEAGQPVEYGQALFAVQV